MARKLGVTTKWLRSQAESGRIPHLRADERFLFVPGVVMKVLADRAAQPQPIGEILPGVMREIDQRRHQFDEGATHDD